MFGKNPSELEVLRLCSLQTLPRGSFSHCFSLSQSQNDGDRESRSQAASLWAFTSIFHMQYETQLIKLQVFAMTCSPSICNKYVSFFSLVFSYSVWVLLLRWVGGGGGGDVHIG